MNTKGILALVTITTVLAAGLLVNHERSMSPGYHPQLVLALTDGRDS